MDETGLQSCLEDFDVNDFIDEQEYLEESVLDQEPIEVGEGYQ